MTGVNLFQSTRLPRPKSALGVTQFPSVLSSTDMDNYLTWTYDKTEDLHPSDEEHWRHFTHLLSEDRQCHVPSQFELLLTIAFVEFDGLKRKQPRQWLSTLLDAPAHCLQVGLLRWSCLDVLLPVEFMWKETVWLCQRRHGQ